jgi:hypothetical protein
LDQQIVGPRELEARLHEDLATIGDDDLALAPA